MAKGKRMVDNHPNKSTHRRLKEEKKFNFRKFFIAFIIILFLLVLGYVAYKYIPNLATKPTTSKNNSENSDFTSVSSTDIKEAKIVEGLETVSITNINISTSDKDSSIIEFHFKNTSNSDIEKNRAHFYALNSEGTIIFGMPLTIPELTAHSETTYRVLCTSNLADAKDYKVSIK